LLHQAVAGAPESLTLRALVGIALALWSANRGMKALITAIGLAYEEPSQRGLIAENLRSLSFVAVFVLVLGLTSLGFVALPHLLDGSVIAEGIGRVLAVLRWPVLFAVVIAGLSALYRWSPARRPASWRWISLGAVVATLCWLGFSSLFSLYSRYAGSLETGHAALDQVIALLLWFFLTAWAILLGAELNAELEHQTARDSTVGPPRPLGERGAFVADDIGASRGSASS
jgi:membrane protein